MASTRRYVNASPWLYHGNGRKRGLLRCPQEQLTADWMLNWVNGRFYGERPLAVTSAKVIGAAPLCSPLCSACGCRPESRPARVAMRCS